MAYENLMVFTGNANPLLAQNVVKRLNIPIGHAVVGKFSDGEVMVEILENVRGKDVFVLQSTCTPTNDNLMELLVMVDALKRASAARVTAAIPYFGYARQDRRPRSARVAISAKVVANMLAAVGVDRVLTMDLHADQIQGFFDVPVDNIYAAPVLLGDVWKQQLREPGRGLAGRRRRGAGAGAREAARVRPRDHRQAPAAAERVGGDEHDRRGRGAHLRDHGRHGRHRRHAVQGARGAEGARARRACSPTARTRCSRAARWSASPSRRSTRWSSPTPSRCASDAQGCKKIRVLSVAGLLAETILRISNEDSVISLFME